MNPLVWIFSGVGLLVLFIGLEGWRQSRALKHRGEDVGERPSLMGAGMLELQKILEPDRDVGAFIEEIDKSERANPGFRAAAEGDEPVAGGNGGDAEEEEQ